MYEFLLGVIVAFILIVIAPPIFDWYIGDGRAETKAKKQKEKQAQETIKKIKTMQPQFEVIDIKIIGIKNILERK